jgi:hypothetical protein
MKRTLILMAIMCGGFGLARGQTSNLLVSGDFQTVQPWRANANLQKSGKVTLLPRDSGVLIHNPVIDLDGSLYQDIATEGHESFAWSARIKGGGMMRASLAFVSLDAKGETLAIVTPTKVNGTKWTEFKGNVSVPTGTTTLRTVLSVLDGDCSFAKLELRKTDERAKSGSKRRPASKGAAKSSKVTEIVAGTGFSVSVLPVERSFWELFCDDLDGDGKPEIVGCDVDGVVTVRREGSLALLTYNAGALVYQFAAADLDGDGTKEILMSSVDPKIPVTAINLKGVVVRTIIGTGGPERLAAGDLDGDGHPEIAVSVGNGLAGSGVAAGVALFDEQGRKLWEKTQVLRNFALGNLVPGGGRELVVGGPAVEFRAYDKAGQEVKIVSVNNGLLEQFQLADINGDTTCDIVASFKSGGRDDRLSFLCQRGNTTLWETSVALGGGSSGSAWHLCGDFDPAKPGLETVVVGTHSVAMLDTQGNLSYQGRTGRSGENWETWAPDGINSLGIACWNGPKPHLYLSSSRFRHRAYYRLQYGGTDELSTFKIPDDEKHLEEIYATVKRQPALPAQGNGKVKVFMALSEFARASEAELREYRAILTGMEAPSLEYLVMYEASDLLGHERGYKLTTDQIVERARLFEKVGIPFGYFATHGGQVWITREAIRRSKEVAPTMFRFLYIAENLETLYSPLYKDVLKWTAATLDFCTQHGMKMIFKEKHDVWGLLPSDPEVSRILFSPAHRATTVPIWSSNQPYQPEIQLGGMLGLRLAGWCREFGMSTQYWNWHEWGRYPRGIRDVTATFVCPSDIMLRLELTGLALGGTWIHVEGGQPYLRADLRQGVAPTALRHRELAYELVRKNLIPPGTVPANLSQTVLVRSFHPALAQGKTQQRKVAYPYYDRNTEALRKGFIPARYLFETYPDYAFPLLAYGMDWNVGTCFPKTPSGWLPVLPSEAWPLPGRLGIHTDGEMVLLDGVKRHAPEAASTVASLVAKGAEFIPLQAPGTSLILQATPNAPGSYVAVMMDPGYLAPTGVVTTVTSTGQPIWSVTDLVSGTPVTFSGGNCPINIQPGAFRILRIDINR